MTYNEKKSLYEKIMRDVANKIVKKEINKKLLKPLNENKAYINFSELTDEQLKKLIYDIQEELMNRHNERLKKNDVEKRNYLQNITTANIDDLYKTEKVKLGDFYITNHDELAGVLEFGPGEEAPVGWSGSWDFFGDSVGDVFEQFNAIEDASKYNVNNNFNDEFTGSIVVYFDYIDKDTLELYNKWKKYSQIRKRHINHIEKRARIYFKNVFSVGASGRDDFYSKMRKAERKLNKSDVSTY